MKSPIGRALFLIPPSAALLMLSACSKETAPEQRATPQSAAVAATCAASASWISNPSEPDFNVDPTDLCGFYQYSWQSFLFLTSPTQSGALNFETFPSVQDVFGIPASRSATLFQ